MKEKQKVSFHPCWSWLLTHFGALVLFRQISGSALRAAWQQDIEKAVQQCICDDLQVIICHSATKAIALLVPSVDIYVNSLEENM